MISDLPYNYLLTFIPFKNYSVLRIRQVLLFSLIITKRIKNGGEGLQSVEFSLCEDFV